MNIKKRLDQYKSVSSGSKQSQRIIPSSLVSLKEYFSAIFPNEKTSYLFIEKKIRLSSDFQKILIENQLKFQLLSKKQINIKIKIDDCLFFDLETTGLMGGTGTFAFLLGFGFFKENNFYIHQYFLPDYGMEYQLFERLQEQYGRKKYLVSYNGKSFDLPLLNTRFIMNRFPQIFKKMVHIDLLHLSRRLWKDSYQSCNLGTIEEKILNRRREGDIPGAFIPQAYFNFLNNGRIHDIIKIISHNYLDILSLGELFLVLGEIENNFLEINDRKVLLRIARLAYEQNNKTVLLALKIKLKEDDDYVFLLASFYKRIKDWKIAEIQWNKLISSKNYHFVALEELAKYHEHKTKDSIKAIQFTERALNQLNTIKALNNYINLDTSIDSFRRRLNRLNKKIS